MKKITVPKIIGFVTGIYAVYTAVNAIKQRAEEQRQREADIEAQITSAIEAKFARNELEIEDK